MARTPDTVVERIQTDIALQRLIEARGIELKKHGQNLIGPCPFHDDNASSLVIVPTSNRYHCSGCGAEGNVIDWVMHTEGISFRHAVELLQNDPSAIGTGNGVLKQSTTPKLDNPLDADDDNELLHQVIDYYHRTLKQSPEALGYLEQRGLNNPELIDHFKLGYANRTLGYRLPEKNRKAGKAIRTRLQCLGLLRESGHEHFNGSLVIPVINNSQILEVYGRKINDRLRAGTPKHLYLPGPHKGVFNVEVLKASSEIIVCKSLIDALTFWSAGYRNVTISYGENGSAEELLQAFKEHNTERVLIAYDRDQSGDEAAHELSNRLLKQGIDCYRICFPKNMDVNSYALKVTSANTSLGTCIRAAEWLGKGTQPDQQRQPSPKIDQPETHQSFDSANEEKTSNHTEYDHNATGVPCNMNMETKADHKEVSFELGDRRYRVRGLDKNPSFNQLKVNILVAKEEALHVDTFDLYSAKARQHFIKQASIELCLKEDIIKKDISQLLLKLEALQEQQLEADHSDKKSIDMLDPEQKQAALELLKDKALLSRILDDFNRAGVVGEETNKLVGYLAAVSRKLDKPLAVMVQSSSAAGKSSLMEAVLAMMPNEDKTQYSAMTGQSLYYMGKTDLKNKILAISEEEGASQASYALKLLHSEGEVSIASTGKDETTGELVTREYRVEGPVMLFLTTTAIDIDEELLNRCLVLSVNETREQTKAIHQIQRQSRTLEGFTLKQQKQTILQQHQNAQRLLKPLAVINPYADQLTFLDTQTRTRRDHEKYLTLIDAIALLHQYQRQIKTITLNDQVIEYIEVIPSDIEMANQLAHEVLGRTLDELPPQTRKLLMLIKTMVDDIGQQKVIKQTDVRFSRKTIRNYTGWSDNQLKVHCKRLVDMEYLLIHRGGRGQTLEYELLYNGGSDSAQPQLTGLIDTKKLKTYHYDAKKLGANDIKLEPNETKLDSSCPQVGPKLDSSCTDKRPRKARQKKAGDTTALTRVKNAFLYAKNTKSYPYTQEVESGQSDA